MLRVGNERANSIFEATLPSNFVRPTDTLFEVSLPLHYS